MSRFFSTSSHHVQSTSMEPASSPTETGDVNGGHCASPYLRRFRIPKLNTFRHHLEEDEDDDEWFEMQMAKHDLIQIRMNELKANRMKDRANNNGRKSQSLKTSKTSMTNQRFSMNDFTNLNTNSNSHSNTTKSKQTKERSDDVESRNGNRCLPASVAAEDEYSGEISEMQTTMRCLWFHPKHLFDIAPSPTSQQQQKKD